MEKIDLAEIYKIAYERGKNDGLLEAQKLNNNTDLPSNETLYKIFNLLSECQEQDEKTGSCYMNVYERYANYITKNWNNTLNEQIQTSNVDAGENPV